MSTPLEPVTPAPPAASQGGVLAWAHELRARERAAGLGSSALTEFQREAWREALVNELTEEERATAPRRLTGRNQRRGSR